MQRFQALFRRQPKTAVKAVSTPTPLAAADLKHVSGGLPYCPPPTGYKTTDLTSTSKA